MRKVDDPGTQAVISTLIFQHDNRDADSMDCSDIDERSDGPDSISTASAVSTEVTDTRREKEKQVNQHDASLV
jgi:hypothetical protein